MSRLAIDIPRMANHISMALPVVALIFLLGGIFIHPVFYLGLGVIGPFLLLNWYYKYVQKKHALLRNFGILGTARYMMESIGPELRQYFYMSDTEEKPFNRSERSEVYRKAKGIDSASAFGTLSDFSNRQVQLRHSFFPVHKHEVKRYSVTFGDRPGCKSFTIDKPFMISAMSFGSLGEHAVRALGRGAKLAGIPHNTGEGGLSPYHLMEGQNIVFQMGTAKFGCRNEDHTLNEEKFKKIASIDRVRMIEIKFSQGAKPGKGGLLPKEKITPEIAKIRHVPIGKDVVSPPRHVECDNPDNTVKFISKVQKLAKKPVGIKFCLGNEKEFLGLVKAMKKHKVYPDYIVVDGAEGGTGAAPKSFMDAIGMPLLSGLDLVHSTLVKEGIRDKLKLVASGKLINVGKQITALAQGADAVYSARGYMLAIGCIQALICNTGHCPVGITTHNRKLQRGLIIEDKAKRVKNYVHALEKEFYEVLSAMGCKNYRDLKKEHLYEFKGNSFF